MNTENHKDEFEKSVKSFFGTFLLVAFIWFAVSFFLNPPNLSSFLKEIRTGLTPEDFIVSVVLLYGVFLLYHFLRQQRVTKNFIKMLDRLFQGNRYD